MKNNKDGFSIVVSLLLLIVVVLVGLFIYSKIVYEKIDPTRIIEGGPVTH